MKEELETLLYHAELRWCHGRVQLRGDAGQTQAALEGFSIPFGLTTLWDPADGESRASCPRYFA